MYKRNTYIVNVNILLEYGRTTYSNIYFDKRKAIEAGIKLLTNSIEYEFTIIVIANNRVEFETVEEFESYYKSLLKTAPKEELYNALLSLVKYEVQTYDNRGNMITSTVVKSDISPDREPTFSELDFYQHGDLKISIGEILEGREYMICGKLDDKCIYDCEDPYTYQGGYVLLDPNTNERIGRSKRISNDYNTKAIDPHIGFKRGPLKALK